MAHLRGEARARYVAEMFTRISRRYDLMNTFMSGGAHHRWRRIATRMVAPEGGWALDVATGTGDFALDLARRTGARHVVGLDMVAAMLELARQKARRAGLEGRVTWLLGDALALPFPSGTFQAITSGFSLRNFTDVPRALSEMARVLAPGGAVALLEITPLRGPRWFRGLFRLYFHRVVPWLGAIVAGQRPAYQYLPESVDTFYDADSLAQLMEDAGLRNVRYRLLGFGTVAIHYGER